MSMFDTIKHLLPRSRAWSIIVDKNLRKLFTALGEVFDDAIEFFDLIWFDMFPATTRHLTQWEAQFGIIRDGLTEQERRDRLAALWSARGGQDPRYIQDTLQAAGFNVYVHEWWDLPRTDPPTVRNPFDYLSGYQYCCGSDEAHCGDTRMICGNYEPAPGDMLVNKLYTTRANYVCCCGDPSMLCGNTEHPLYPQGIPTLCGANSGVLFERVEYPIPTDPADWPYIMYLGGETFGDFVSIDSTRKDEFEDLCLKICPTHLWIGLLISFEGVVIEGSTGNAVLEGSTGNTVVITV